jgi:Maltokinase N-terminal cap domain
VALLHKATITPAKLEALTAWLPGRSWLDGADVSTLTQVGAYRFDDPAGAVGIETLLVRSADGRLLQVPLSYRAAPLAGADDALVTTLDHSVLGRRWMYDGCADPVAMRALAAAILTGGHEAELELDTGAGRERREPTVRVVGSGAPPAAVPELTAVTATDGPDGTVVTAGAVVLTVRRRLDGPEPPTAGAQTLRGTWAGTDAPVLLSTARPA